MPHDDVILRDKDANTAWTSASDGTLEQRRYLLSNWRGDMVAVIRHDGAELIEQARYSAYGVPIGIPGGDCNGDGTVNGFDQAIVLGAYAPAYEARADLNLDGVVDNFDLAILLGNWGNTLGWDKLSLPGVFNRRGYAGYELDGSLSELYHVRHRVLQSRLGRWISRDLLEYVDGMNLYEYGQSNPWANVDPMGLACKGGGCGGIAGAGPSFQPPGGGSTPTIAWIGGHDGGPVIVGCTEASPLWPCCLPTIAKEDGDVISGVPTGLCGGGGGGPLAYFERFLNKGPPCFELGCTGPGSLVPIKGNKSCHECCDAACGWQSNSACHAYCDREFPVPAGPSDCYLFVFVVASLLAARSRYKRTQWAVYR